jgi:hypothetical protein
MNMVERFFRDLTTERLRRGGFTSVPELIAAINRMLKKSILDFFSPQSEKCDFHATSSFQHLRWKDGGTALCRTTGD